MGLIIFSVNGCDKLIEFMCITGRDLTNDSLQARSGEGEGIVVYLGEHGVPKGSMV